MSYTSGYSYGNNDYYPEALEASKSNRIMGILIGSILGLFLLSICVTLCWAYHRSLRISAAREAISAGRDLELGRTSNATDEPLPAYIPPAGPPPSSRDLHSTTPAFDQLPRIEPPPFNKDNGSKGTWTESSPLPPYEMEPDMDSEWPMEEVFLDAPSSSGSSRETLVDNEEAPVRAPAGPTA